MNTDWIASLFPYSLLNAWIASFMNDEWRHAYLHRKT